MVLNLHILMVIIIIGVGVNVLFTVLAWENLANSLKIIEERDETLSEMAKAANRECKCNMKKS